MTAPIKITLDEKGFYDLVAGKMIHVPGIEIDICLKDIGFPVMINAIRRAQFEQLDKVEDPHRPN